MLNVNEDYGGLHKDYRNSLKSWALCLPLQEDEPPNPQRNPCQLWGSLAGDSKPAPSTEIKFAREHNPAHSSEQQQNKNKNKKKKKQQTNPNVIHFSCCFCIVYVVYKNTMVVCI